MRTSGVVPGYFNDPEKTAEAFPGGFYRTGDLVATSVESDGTYVDVLGRASTALKLSNGRWVHPEALEQVYRRAPGVRHVFVHGTADYPGVVAVRMWGRSVT